MIDGVCRDVIKALGDGYEASGIPTVAVDRRIRTIWPGATLAAPAYPLECAPGDNLAIHIAMERAPRGSVLVVATGGFVAGYWGEVLTAMAEAAGVAGRSTRIRQGWPMPRAFAQALRGRTIAERPGSGCDWIDWTKGPSAATTALAPMAMANARYNASQVDWLTAMPISSATS